MHPKQQTPKKKQAEASYMTWRRAIGGALVDAGKADDRIDARKIESLVGRVMTAIMDSASDETRTKLAKGIPILISDDLLAGAIGEILPAENLHLPVNDLIVDIKHRARQISQERDDSGRGQY